jgi:hypothetical protein
MGYKLEQRMSIGPPSMTISIVYLMTIMAVAKMINAVSSVMSKCK